jgi:hypothetical protein
VAVDAGRYEEDVHDARDGRPRRWPEHPPDSC